MISVIFGGIGLFLLGMVLMTEGLKAAAGDALRRVLGRFTGGALQAFLSGAGVTVLVQSSSATILTTLGFVSAGLLTFTQSIGVILGAATGTTSTGWIVSLLGLRLQISAVALPLVGIGALLRLLTHGRSASLGMALAGFGLIFVGIDTLQAGMQTLSERLDPAMFPGDTVPGRLLLVALGVVMTVVMQSSSAAVATTLTALHTGTIHLEQAALLVIGQNMGTAVTAALASIGAAVAAKRTALAHVLFNCFAGALGLALLPAFLRGADWLGHTGRGVDGAVAIAAFHTGFNLAAVAVILPLVGGFARLVVRLLPERGPVLTRNLDASVAEVAPVAVEAARRTTIEVGAVVLDATRRLLRGDGTHRPVPEMLERSDHALAETRRFLGAVRTSRATPAEHQRHLAVLHAIDHFDRLVDGLRNPHPQQTIHADAHLRRFARELAEQLTTPLLWLEGRRPEAPLEAVRTTAVAMADTRREQRPRLMTETASGETDPDLALAQLDAMRWLDRIAYHVWRAVEHLGTDAAASEPGRAPAESGADERA
jgi:phosphate:Na+ symporter